jgi:Raf kinase inhibitor-like YbhB/YbcL family protein
MSTLSLTSPAFAQQQPIPVQHTADGANRSPALSWSGVPTTTAELALICDDPDAPRADPWVHWVLYGLPPDVAALSEGVPTQERLPSGACQGLNDFRQVGYGGPAPPRGHGTHHYHFKLYALDKALGLAPRAPKQRLLDAMSGHILAQTELIGTYRR